MESKSCGFSILFIFMLAAALTLCSDCIADIYALRVNTNVSTANHSPADVIDLSFNEALFAYADNSFEDPNTGRYFECLGASDIEYAELYAEIYGMGGPGPTGLGNSALVVNAMFLETLTFEGDFNDHLVPVHGAIEGYWDTNSAPLQMAQVRAQLWVVDGNVPITEEDLSTVSDYNSLLFDPNITRLFAEFPIENAPEDANNAEINLYVDGHIPLNGHNPAIKVIFGITVIVLSDQEQASWETYYTGILDFDFTGLTVYSQSGVFPGTTKVQHVDMPLYSKMASNWLNECDSPDWCEGTDLNADKVVDFVDLKIFGDQWLDLRPVSWLLGP